MHVVGHHFQRVNRRRKLIGDRAKQLHQALLDRSNQHGTTKLRAPHEVKLQGEDRPVFLAYR